MALKGTTKIELTNVKTGEVEILQETNMVTNAISDILNTDPLHLRWGSDLFRGYCLPILNNLVGGIVLFENKLEEDPAKYYALESNPIIGYSNMEVSPDTDVKRGSMNQTESGPLEDGTGYRFVFDFANTQGNGKISAVSLTSAHMGACGYSAEVYDDHVASSDNNYMANRKTAFPLEAYYAQEAGNTKNARLASCITSMDIENGCVYALVSEEANSISVYRFPLFMDEVGLFSKKAICDPELFHTITTTSFQSRNPTSTNYYSFCDGGDGFVWGFEGKNNAEVGGTIGWIKIDKSDWTATEGTWTLPVNVYAGGSLSSISASSFINRCKTLVKDGFAYFIASGNKSIVIVNVNNPTDITVQESQKDITPFYTSSPCCYMNTLGNVVYLSGAHIKDRTLYDGYPQTNNRYVPGLYQTGRPNVRYGPVVFGFAENSTNINVRMCLDNSYLATINNLQTSVQKTADKTMKITYILREES